MKILVGSQTCNDGIVELLFDTDKRELIVRDWRPSGDNPYIATFSFQELIGTLIRHGIRVVRD